MIAEPCVIVGCAVMGCRERGVTRDVRVHFVRAVVVRIEFVRMGVQERRAERPQRDGHRQPDHGQRPYHAVIVRETNRTVKPDASSGSAARAWHPVEIG